VVNHLQEAFREEQIGIACIYCDYKDRIEQTPVNMIGSLLRQLVQVEEQLPISDQLNALYQDHQKRNTRPLLEECSTALQSEVRRYKKVFVVVDALDECSEDNGFRARLFKELGELKGAIKLMVTSRPHVNVESELGGVRLLEVLASTDDVQRYLDERVSGTPRLAHIVGNDVVLQKTIVDTIIEKIQGM
jgi:hypothetical protein